MSKWQCQENLSILLYATDSFQGDIVKEVYQSRFLPHADFKVELYGKSINLGLPHAHFQVTL
jgi:hypothetical protein